MKITQALLDSLSAKAIVSPRLRMNYDLRNSESDQSQRMLNAIELGCTLPIHRHPNTSETVVCLRGHLREVFYDEEGNKIDEIDLQPSAECIAVDIPAGQWHTVEVIESGTVILEMKDGKYEPIKPEDILNKDLP